jgi:hypothetical protein
MCEGTLRVNIALRLLSDLDYCSMNGENVGTINNPHQQLFHGLVLTLNPSSCLNSKKQSKNSYFYHNRAIIPF